MSFPEDGDHDGPLRRLFTTYVREPETSLEVYGYVASVSGYLLAMVGAILLVAGPTAHAAPGKFIAREIAFVSLAFGVPLWFLGIILLLSIGRDGVLTALIGFVASEASVLYFTILYPEEWLLGGSSLVSLVIAAYVMGLAMITGVAVMAPLLGDKPSPLLAWPSVDGTGGPAGAGLVPWLLQGLSFIGIPLAVAGLVTLALAVLVPALWNDPGQASTLGIGLAAVGSLPVVFALLLERQTG